jgi:transposase-like protein
MYLRTEVQNIMHRLITAKVEEIVPVIDFNTSEIRYPILDAIGLDPVDNKILESMAHVGIVEKSLYEKLLVCPDHPDTLAITMRLYCPKCKSFDVFRMNLVEHRICGFIATKEVFENNKLVCPSCSAPIRDQKDISFPGMWYECKPCKSKFDSPTIMMRCRNHNHDFTINESKKIDVFSYKLKKETEKEFYDNYVLVAPLRKILEPAGFKVEAAVSVKGKSGVSHKVTLHAHTSDVSVIIDAKTADSQVPDQFLIAMFAKVIDVNPKLAFFVAMPNVSENTKALAKNYGIIVIEGNTLAEVLNGIVENLNAKLNLKIRDQFKVTAE